MLCWEGVSRVTLGDTQPTGLEVAREFGACDFMNQNDHPSGAQWSPDFSFWDWGTSKNYILNFLWKHVVP